MWSIRVRRDLCVCCILDWKDICGSDIHGETFCILKEKDLKLFGEFRSRRLVLDAWDKLLVRQQGHEGNWTTSVESP
jgi:hypothetical protein